MALKPRAHDARGRRLANQLDQSDFSILNELTATRITASCQSSPDITAASTSLLNRTNWCTKVAMNSDHVPIVISLERSITFCTADRNSYIRTLPKLTGQGFWNILRKSLTSAMSASLLTYIKAKKRSAVYREKAARIFIPAGKIPIIRPNFPTKVVTLADQKKHNTIINNYG